MKKIIYLVILSLSILVSNCTERLSNKQNAIRILKQNGYSNIEITGYQYLACGKDDFYRTGFIATSPSGYKVAGAVCSGLIAKYSTIRIK